MWNAGLDDSQPIWLDNSPPTLQEPRLLGEISTISDIQMITVYWQKVKWNKECLDDGEIGEWGSDPFSRSVVSNSLRPHGLQHASLPCPSPTTGAYSSSFPLSRWCHPTISSSVVPFFFLQSFPASGPFLVNKFFASGGLSIGVSASVSVFPMNIQDWFPLGLTDWIFLQSKGLSRLYSKEAGLKLNIQKTKIMAKSPITLWQINGGKVETL